MLSEVQVCFCEQKLINFSRWLPSISSSSSSVDDVWCNKSWIYGSNWRTRLPHKKAGRSAATLTMTPGRCGSRACSARGRNVIYKRIMPMTVRKWVYAGDSGYRLGRGRKCFDIFLGALSINGLCKSNILARKSIEMAEINFQGNWSSLMARKIKRIPLLVCNQ